MKLELKAYKCIFPNFFTDCYNIYKWQDDKQFEVIYGKTQKEAVKKRCIKDEFYSYWELKRNINTRRFKDGDLYSLPKSELLNSLQEPDINILLHALGVVIGQKMPRDFYRNYYMMSIRSEPCEYLCLKGLMSVYNKGESYIYYVTEKGIEAVKTLLLHTKETI